MSINSKIKLSNGWTVILSESRECFLNIKPIPNSLFQLTKSIEIPYQMYLDAKNGQKDVMELIKKYDLLDSVIGWKKQGNTKTFDSEVKFHGGGWFIEKLNDNYFLEYIKSGHGGGGRRIPIDAEIFSKIKKTGKDSSLSDLLDIYNLRYLDVPENDV